MSHIVVQCRAFGEMRHGPTYFGDKFTTDPALVTALGAELNRGGGQLRYKVDKPACWLLDELHKHGYHVIGFTSTSESNLYWTLRKR